MEKLLIVFVKNPELGKVKTRLGKSIGDKAALEVYLKLLDHTRQTAAATDCDVAVYYSSFIDREDAWGNQQFDKHRQEGKDIGLRMHNAIAHAIVTKNYKQVCLVGGDIYDLTPSVIEEGFNKLENHDVVIGPAEDGGYYLIGMTSPNQNIFKLEAWSVPDVYDHTIRLINKEGLTYATLKILNDIDTIEDTEGTDLLD